MAQDAANEARRMLVDAHALMANENPLVSVSGERIVAILVDLLMDIDPTETTDPWGLLMQAEETL